MTPNELLTIGQKYGKDAVKAFSKNHADNAKAANKNNTVAEFFGKNILKDLLGITNDTTNSDVFGIRIYYGLAFEDDDTKGLSHKPTAKGKLKPRLFLVPVDKDGNDMQDFSQGKDPGGNGAGNGAVCPQFCNEKD